MRVADLVVAAGLALLGGLVVYDALRLGIGWGTDGPKSGFFPFWLAVGLIGCSLVVFARALATRGARPFVADGAIRPVLKMLVPAVGYVVVMQAVGLYVASALYMAIYMRWIGRHPWPAVSAVAIGFAVVTFVVFERWFLVPMPKGPLETWLGY
jgi:putative tricarboxylic transport membrane protein